eukprot:g79859.t1
MFIYVGIIKVKTARLALFLHPTRRWNAHFPWLPITQVRHLAARTLFQFPFLREIVLGSGCVDAGRQTAELCLKKGLSIMLYPGGEMEQVHSRPDAEVVWVKKRAGFARLAILAQAPIIPVYVFGETKIYRQVHCCRAARVWIAKHLWVGIPGILPLPPCRVTLQVVFGQPITPPPLPADLAADSLTNHHTLVQGLHAQYITALQTLYQEYQTQCGYEHVPLLVL